MQRKLFVGVRLGLVLSALALAHLLTAQEINTTMDAAEIGGCPFTRDQPRYYQILSTLSVENAGSDTLINDALIRALRRSLMVSECQIVMSEGVACTSGTQELPCADPVHLCSSTTTSAGTVLTDDVYDAIISESCDTNGDGLVDSLDGTMRTLVCEEVLEAGTAVQTLAKQGGCTAVCDVDALLAGNSTTLQSTTMDSCLSFDLTLNVATEEAASALQSELLSDEVNRIVTSTLSGFGSTPLEYSIAESTIVEAVGFGFFPPPPPPAPPLVELAANVNGGSSEAFSNTLVYGEWSSCYPSCGDGISTRVATCVDGDGAVLALGDCPGGLRAVRTGTVGGLWTEILAPDPVVYNNTITLRSLCAYRLFDRLIIRQETSKACSTPCKLPYWQYGPWQTCDRRCGTGQSTRTAACVSDGVTKCPLETRETLTRDCNTVPCEVFSWVQSTWSKCSAECGSGTQSRNVTCVGSDGSEAPESSCNESRMPAASRVCNSQPCDFCQTTVCLGRGTCFDGKCQCDGNYAGDHCELHSSCKAGVVDAGLACCTSGVLDSQGTCCPAGSSVDGAGACCSGTVDACGVCNGAGAYVDIQGQCCAVVDADGMCCASGLIDECGVCNGVGNTCNIVLGLNMRVPSNILTNNTVQPESLDAYLEMIANVTGVSADRISVGGVTLADGGSLSVLPPSPAGRKLLQSAPATTNLLVQVEIAPDVNKQTEVPFSSAYYAQIIPDASTNYGNDAFGVESVPVASRSGVCGNGMCELGERSVEGASPTTGTCAEDCGLPSKVCAGGCANGGVCLPASGVCQCLNGYTGTSCGECAEGYSRNGDGSACVINVAEQGIISASVLGDNGEALVSGTSSSGTSAGIIVGAVFGAILGTVLLAAVSYLIWRRCKYGSGSPQFTTNQLYGHGDHPESSDASDLGLRKKYGLTPHTFGYSDSLEMENRIGVGQYHENPMYGGLGDGLGIYKTGIQQEDPEHRVMCVTRTTFEPTSSDQNSGGFCRELYIKDPSPERILMKVVQDDLVDQEGRFSQEGSGYIKAGVSPLCHGAMYEYDGQHDERDGEIKVEESAAAESLGHSSPGLDNYHGECVSIGSESRMIFNPAFSMRGEADQTHHEYPKTVVAPRHGDPSELTELDARRLKLDALRAAVRSLENSRAPSRETSFSSGDIVDVESIAGRTLPPPPAAVPGLNLCGMEDKTSGTSKPPSNPVDSLKQHPTSFFATVKRALTPPRFRRPVSATESSNEMESDIDIERSSMGSFTKVLAQVDDALAGKGGSSRATTKRTVFDATGNFA